MTCLAEVEDRVVRVGINGEDLVGPGDLGVAEA